jgi:hypothetical protein
MDLSLQEDYEFDESDILDYLGEADEPLSKKSRFADPLTEEDIKEKVKEKIPAGTKQKEKWAIGLLKSWQAERNSQGIVTGNHVFKNVDDFTAGDLDYVLSFFILEVRNEKGERYKSNTLKGMIAMIQHYYNTSLQKGWSIFLDQAFQRCRNSLDLAMKESRESGCDRIKRRAEVLDKQREETLWEKRCLGDDTAQKLVHTLIYLFGKNFALRSREEHRNIKTGNLRKCYDHQLRRNYIEYTEDISKTSKGGLRDNREPKRSKAYDNPLIPSRCIVRLYEKYMSHRPDGIDDFYLTPILSVNSKRWYKKSPMGINTISKVVSNLCERAEIPGYFTNHSLKRGTRTILANAGFGSDLVTKKTGHISRSELDYLALNNITEAAMSDSLNYCNIPATSGSTHDEDLGVISTSKSRENVSSSELVIVENVNNVQMSTIEIPKEKPTLIIEKNDSRLFVYL